jgi:zinc D-Ala-D-Ala carboxypeptidase
MTQLSKNFTLEELTVTDTGAVNVPNEEQKHKLMFLAQYLLQPIRDKFGRLHINSAFRSEFVNEKIGGSKTSQHMEAEAADVRPEEAEIDTVFEWCRANLFFGQLIYEHKGGAWWIHISLPRLDKQNMMVMKFENGTYTNV